MLTTDTAAWRIRNDSNTWFHPGESGELQAPVILLINGASSSGKTSLARALQACWEGPLLHWSLDMLISQLPYKYTGSGSHAHSGFEVLRTPSCNKVVAGDHGMALNTLSSNYVRSLADADYDLVVDYLFLDDQFLAPFRHSLRNHQLCFVGLRCDEKILAKRNLKRRDRASSLAVAQQTRIHFCREHYDLSLDSSQASPEELASGLVAFLASHPVAKGIGPYP